MCGHAARLPRERQRAQLGELPGGVLPRVGGNRLAIANDNVPNMVGQISTCLASGLNIADLLNKSRGDLAYTLIDTDAPVARRRSHDCGRFRRALRKDGVTVPRPGKP